MTAMTGRQAATLIVVGMFTASAATLVGGALMLSGLDPGGQAEPVAEQRMSGTTSTTLDPRRPGGPWDPATMPRSTVVTLPEEGAEVVEEPEGASVTVRAPLFGLPVSTTGVSVAPEGAPVVTTVAPVAETTSTRGAAGGATRAPDAPGTTGAPTPTAPSSTATTAPATTVSVPEETTTTEAPSGTTTTVEEPTTTVPEETTTTSALELPPVTVPEPVVSVVETVVGLVA